VQATFAATLFDEWIRSGLVEVVVAPGSRSTPLVLAAAERSELTVHVRLDERSAGFFALGRALATSRPVAIVVTSGTAAAELHAALCEADQANVPLVVVTADRPPELHGVGAPQTIHQRELFGPVVRRFEEPGVARMDAAWSWRPLASRVWHAASGDTGRPGPVHVNAAFTEPLVGVARDLAPGRPDGATWRCVEPVPPTTAPLDVRGARVLCVVGAGVHEETIGTCRDLDWVVLGDATARGTLPYFDPLLRDDEFARTLRPDLVVRMGGMPASKVLANRLREWGTAVVALLGSSDVADPDGVVSRTLPGLPRRDVASMRADSSFAAAWFAASQSVGEYLRSLESDDDELDEPMVARSVVELSGDHQAPLVVGSSMPVRDVEWWASARRGPTYANRGVNGIDGVVSTALGVCSGSRGIGLVGDLTMLHDVSGLVDGLGPAEGTCVLVVVDNGGGGIFSFLPQAQSLAPERFEQLFGTPRPHDLEAVARAFGHGACTVGTRSELRTAVEKALTESGLSVVVAKVPSRERNVQIHDDLVRSLKNRRVIQR
jgi:2-succinyl-5-enolpyruvyl-6-hydroxy-3-cyclohexene-1-carboxylate synthase